MQEKATVKFSYVPNGYTERKRATQVVYLPAKSNIFAIRAAQKQARGTMVKLDSIEWAT